MLGTTKPPWGGLGQSRPPFCLLVCPPGGLCDIPLPFAPSNPIQALPPIPALLTIQTCPNRLDQESCPQ